ncbi:MAG: hypothetical protein ABEJ92_09775 [Halobacteriales archaeon]
MATYYDFVLAFIPLTLLGVPGMLTGVGLDLTIAVPLGATVAAALIGHAMFVNGPTDDVTRRADARFAPTAD